MTQFALLVPRTCRTPDKRTIAWIECEFHDGEEIVRNPQQAFFSPEAARAWVTAQGYDLRS